MFKQVHRSTLMQYQVYFYNSYKKYNCMCCCNQRVRTIGQIVADSGKKLHNELDFNHLIQIVRKNQEHRAAHEHDYGDGGAKPHTYDHGHKEEKPQNHAEGANEQDKRLDFDESLDNTKLLRDSKMNEGNTSKVHPFLPSISQSKYDHTKQIIELVCPPNQS